MTINIPQIPKDAIDKLYEEPKTCIKRLPKHLATLERMCLCPSLITMKSFANGTKFCALITFYTRRASLCRSGAFL